MGRPKKYGENTVSMNFSIEPEFKQTIEKNAKLQGISASEYIVRIMKANLSGYDFNKAMAKHHTALQYYYMGLMDKCKIEEESKNENVA